MNFISCLEINFSESLQRVHAESACKFLIMIEPPAQIRIDLTTFSLYTALYSALTDRINRAIIPKNRFILSRLMRSLGVGTGHSSV